MFSFRPPFADTVAILAAGETRHAGGNVYVALPTDPLARPHVYGPGWLATGALGLRASDAIWVGAILAIVFVATAVLTLRPRTRGEVIVSWLLLCSPPVLLGVSRGNNDLVMFIMFAAAAWLLSRPAVALGLLGYAMVGLAAVLKLYPFAVLPALLLRFRSSSPPGQPHRYVVALLWFGATTAVCFGVVWYWADDYRAALSLAPSPTSFMSYGISLTSLSWLGLFRVRPFFILGLAAGVLVAGDLLGRRVRQVWTMVSDSGFASLSFMLGALAWSFSFLAIRSYPYRFLLLLLPVRLWLDATRARESGAAARFQLWLWIAVAWLDIPKRALAQSVDAPKDSPAWQWKCLAGVVGFEQALVIVLTTCLVISAGGAFVRWWKPAAFER
jgi:hypothetical protein